VDRLLIEGGHRLEGTVKIGGSKNAALPLLVSSLLSTEESEFTNVPRLNDSRTILRVLESLGVQSQGEFHEGRVRLKGPRASSCEADYDLVRKMRASVLVLGPLLARFGQAKVSLPGGCAIGTRPVDLHLEGLRAMGAEIELEQGYILARAGKLKGTAFQLDFPSVGATENLMMAACLAEGQTILKNCAREPEIVDLADSLRSMGAQIEGDGSSTVMIHGQEKLKGARHTVMGDRIEAGTFLAAALLTRGRVRVEGICPHHLEAVLQKFEEAGARIEREENAIVAECREQLKGTDITTQPFPGFPTDMQAQFMALMTTAEGASVITETIFENRFMHVPELTRMGADIRLQGKTATIRGVEGLKGAPVMATDLRASAALVMGGLIAERETVVNRVYHLDRGYDRLEEKFFSLGGKIHRVRTVDYATQFLYPAWHLCGFFQPLSGLSPYLGRSFVRPIDQWSFEYFRCVS